MKRLLAVLVLAGCPGPSGGPDATAVTFTGGYEDWDSTDAQFLGVVDATVTEVAHPDNTATTAPNGRSVLDITSDAVTYVKDGYLPGRYTVDDDVVATGPYDLRGISTTRLATFFSTELGGISYDAGKALVEIELHTDGASVTVGGVSDGFHGDSTVGWSAGNTQAGGAAYLVFPNVAPGDVAIAVTPSTCLAPPVIHAQAGELAMTTIVCPVS